MHKKEWLIKLSGKRQGPFSIMELRANRKVTPRTPVKKPSWKQWVEAGEVEELRSLFRDPESTHQQQVADESPAGGGGEQVLLYDPEPKWKLFLLLLLILMLSLYVIYHF